MYSQKWQYFLVVLICNSSVTYDVEHFVICVFTISISFLVKCLQIFCSLFNWPVVFFLLLSFKCQFFVYFRYNSFIRYEGVFPRLQANNHNFIDVGRRHKILVSETKDFTAYSIASGMSFLLTLASLALSSLQDDRVVWGGEVLHRRQVCVTAEELQPQEAQIFSNGLQGNFLNFHLRGRTCFYYTAL